MAKRFSRYKFAAKVSGGGATAGSALDKYNQYRNGTTRLNYPRAASSNPGNLKIVYLKPFGDPGTASQYYQVTMSSRAWDERANLVNAVAILQLLEDLGANTVIGGGNFQPAKAVVQTGGTGIDPEISQITGEPYKKKTGAASFTLPFGTDGTKLFKETAIDINASVEAKNANNTVSFLPERHAGL